MPAHSFTVTAATPEITLDPDGKGFAAFTVTNTTPRTVRGQARIHPLGATDPGWLKIAGGMEFDFAASESRQVGVNLHTPSKAAPGKYNFRLDFCSTANPDDDFTEGPEVAFTIPEVPPPPELPKRFPMWILLAILGVVLVGGGITVWMLSKGDPAPIPGKIKVNIPKFTDVLLSEAPSVERPPDVTIILEPQYDLEAKTNTKPKDTIIDQKPLPGEHEVESASDVRVTVFLQPPMTTMPDLRGKTEVEARDRLKVDNIPANKGFRITRDLTQLGRVLDQDTEPGTPLAVGKVISFSIGARRVFDRAVLDAAVLTSAKEAVKPPAKMTLLKTQ